MLVTIIIFTGVLSKQMLKKIKSLITFIEDLVISNNAVIKDSKEEISKMSDPLINEPRKLHASFHLCVTNSKKKLHEKSRRFINHYKLTTICCSYCNKAYCYQAREKGMTAPILWITSNE